MIAASGRQHVGDCRFTTRFTKCCAIPFTPGRTPSAAPRPAPAWLRAAHTRHEGYIDWDTYERNRRLIADNAQMKGVMVKGAPREGRSLLAGLLRCKRCGRKLHVAYSGVGGKVPRYSCRGAAINHGAGQCISF